MMTSTAGLIPHGRMYHGLLEKNSMRFCVRPRGSVVAARPRQQSQEQRGRYESATATRPPSFSASYGWVQPAAHPLPISHAV